MSDKEKHKFEFGDVLIPTKECIEQFPKLHGTKAVFLNYISYPESVSLIREGRWRKEVWNYIFWRVPPTPRGANNNE